MYAKRWVSFALAAIMAAGILAGCDSQQGGDGSSSSSSSSSSQVSGGGSGGSGGNHSSGGSSHETTKSYTVTAVIGEGGAVTCNKQQVESGDSFKNVPADTKVTFTVTPDDGYEIADVIATGGTLTSDGKGNYTLTVTANCTVSVTFAGILRDVEFEPIDGKSLDTVLRNELTKDDKPLIQEILTEYDPNYIGEYTFTEKILNRILRNVMLANGTDEKIEVIREKISAELLDYVYGTDQEVVLCTGAAGLNQLNSRNDTCTYLEVFNSTSSEAIKNAIVKQLKNLPVQSNPSSTDECYGYSIVINGVTLGSKGYTAMLVIKYMCNTSSPVIPTD